VSDWWTEPYAGGPLVPVDGFPRPLYPPDAKTQGKTPSADGPDVVAYKRTVCRAGRWGEWDPASWDDSYSNGFAHGRGGNVADTGVAGVQRQQHIDDTGWLGERTFNTLRSIRVPDGPRMGEMCMDSVAVKLINEAYAIFQGHEPPPGGQGTVRRAALSRAVSQIGIKESPAGSNRCKFTDWYGMVGPWCAMFASWAFELAAKDIGKDSPSFARGSKYAYVPYVVADARANRNGLRTTDDPIPGDLVCYDWQNLNDVYDHVGIFEKWIVGAGDFSAIEGNTSTSNDSNGGEVMRRTRNRTRQSTVFVRVSEP
jgi:hypothetical protein